MKNVTKISDPFSFGFSRSILDYVRQLSRSLFLIYSNPVAEPLIM